MREGVELLAGSFLSSLCLLIVLAEIRWSIIVTSELAKEGFRECCRFLRARRCLEYMNPTSARRDVMPRITPAVKPAMVPMGNPVVGCADELVLSVCAAAVAVVAVLVPDLDKFEPPLIDLLVEEAVFGVTFEVAEVVLGMSDIAVMNVAGIVVMPSDSVKASALRTQQSAPSAPLT